MVSRRPLVFYIRLFGRTVLPALRPVIRFFAAIGFAISLSLILMNLTTTCRISAGSIQAVITRVQLQRLGKALEDYRTDCGGYPDLHLGLNALLIDPGVKGWNGPYAKQPLADAWGRPYLYEFSDRIAIVRSLGADGKPGGDLFDADLSSQNPFAPLRETRLHAAEHLFGDRVAPWLLLAVSTYALLRSRPPRPRAIPN